MGFLKGIVTSKKLGAMIAGTLTVVFGEGLGLSPETVAEVVKLIMAYIVGQSAVDLGLSLKGQKFE